MDRGSSHPRLGALVGLLVAAGCTEAEEGESDTASEPCDDLVGPGFAIVAGGPYVGGFPCGDINGDGLDDVVVHTASTTAYVVFGKADPAPVVLADLAPAEGFEIRYASGDLEVFPAGDINGDGFDDLALAFAGQIRVLPGGAESASWVLDAGDASPPLVLEGGGNYSVGDWIAAAGDVNGDGFDDLLVNHAEPYFSTTHVIFGDDAPEFYTPEELAADVGGIAIVAYGGVNVAGDVNGDGIDDLAVVSSRGPFEQGFDGVDVVFGGPTLHSLEYNPDEPPSFDGYAIRVDGASISLSADGGEDVDGDGRADFVIADEYSDGPMWVLYGKAGVDAVHLPDDLSDETGFPILTGTTPEAWPWLRLLPDLDGDGHAEIEIYLGGEAYVVRGKADGATVDLAAVALGEGGYARSDRAWAHGLTLPRALSWAEIDGAPGLDAVVSVPPGPGSPVGCTYVYFAPPDR
ncbi:MAG: VCBS repeat-containing protein [Myxococcales bacterium]|nr:VCBS repeat-containing protein [Myxococcales bacterium]